MERFGGAGEEWRDLRRRRDQMTRVCPAIEDKVRRGKIGMTVKFSHILKAFATNSDGNAR
jgi:hypothetical protein